MQPCAGGFLQGLPPGLLPLGGLDGRQKEVEEVSSPSIELPKAQPFSGKRSGGELATCRVGWLRTDFRRVLAGTHSVPRRSLPTLASMRRSQAGRALLTLSMEGALCGRSQPPAISGPIVSKERGEVLHTVGKNLGPLRNERRRARPGQDPPPNLSYTEVRKICIFGRSEGPARTEEAPFKSCLEKAKPFPAL